MKIRLIGAGWLLAATAIAGSKCPPYSANVVGCVTIMVPPSNQVVMVASSFEPIFGKGARTLLDVFGRSSGLRKSDDPRKADRVYVWDNEKAHYLVVCQGEDGIFYEASAGLMPTNPVVPRGCGLMIQSPSAEFGGTNATKLTLSGQVPTDPTHATDMSAVPSASAHQMMLGNPYPVQKSLNELINTTNGATAGATPATCDKVFLWDAASQHYTILGLKSPMNVWRDVLAWDGTDTRDYTIAPGQGFWFHAQGTNVTWTETKSYKFP